MFDFRIGRDIKKEVGKRRHIYKPTFSAPHVFLLLLLLSSERGTNGEDIPTRLKYYTVYLEAEEKTNRNNRHTLRIFYNSTSNPQPFLSNLNYSLSIFYIQSWIFLEYLRKPILTLSLIS